MSRLAALPDQASGPDAPSVRIPKAGAPLGIMEDGRLLTLQELAARLHVTRSKIEADVLAGLPCLDLGTPRPRPAGLPAPRRKRALRFNWQQVIRWYAERRGPL